MDDADDAIDDDDNVSSSTFLTFRIGGAEYALPVLLVTEIVRLPTWHPLPDVPPYVCGVVNLRGRVVPIMDLHMRFGLGAHHATKHTVVVVVDVDGAATGLVVDGVTDVAEFVDIDDNAAVAAGARGDLLRGIAKKGDRVVFVLDPTALLAPVPSTTAVAA